MAVCRVSTTAEIVSRLGTLPVAILRMIAVSQVATRPASRPTSRPYSQAARAAAPTGRPADSIRLQSAVRSNRRGRGSSRCSRMAESLGGREGAGRPKPGESQRIPSSGRDARMFAQVQSVENRVIATAADGHEVLQAAIFSETQAPVMVQGRRVVAPDVEGQHLDA